VDKTRRLSIIFTLSLLLNSCSSYYMSKYNLPQTMQSNAVDSLSVKHVFAPNRINYGVCGDTLYALWGKAHDDKLDLFLSWAAKPVVWNGVRYVGTFDTTVMQEWGAIPAEIPVDFDCRQSLLTQTSQSKDFEIFQSPVQSPYRCASLYSQYVTVVDRKTRKAMVTDIPLGRDVEFFAWKGKLWIADTTGLTGFTTERYATDSDGDGLTDALENILGTRADQVDTDHDGIPDALDAQPLAAPRTLTQDELAYKAHLEKQLHASPIDGACTQFVNVIAPSFTPFEINVPANVHLVWNAPLWRGISVK